MNMVKSRRNIILALLTALICLGAEPSRGSVLSDVANSMPAGTWATLNTIGMDANFLQYPGGNGAISTQYFGAATWDSVSRQVLFQGAGHYNAGMLHKYSESTNTWTRSFPLPSGLNLHGYYHNAVSVSRRILGVFNPAGVIQQYHIDTGIWDDSASFNCQGCFAMALIFFPERDRWYVGDGKTGNVHEYNPTTKTWATTAASACFWPAGAAPFDYLHNFAAYNPVRHEIVFGGGNGPTSDSFSSCKMDAQGTITVLPLAPTPLKISAGNTNGASITIEPAGVDLLVLTQHGEMYVFDFDANQWSLLPNPPSMPPGMQEATANTQDGFVVPIDTYGVVLYMDPKNPPGIYLYKHAQGGTPVTPPPAVVAPLGIGSLPSVDTTPPSAPTQLTLAPSGNPPPLAGTSFSTLCQLSTTIFCQDFDVLPPNNADISEGIFSNGGSCVSLLSRPDASCPELDNGTLKFTVHSNSGAGNEGQYYVRFADFVPGGQNLGPGKEFFYQWKQKFSASFLGTRYEAIGGGFAGGWKQGMVGSKDEYSCASNEIVVQNSYQRGYPQMYHSCGYYEGFEVGGYPGGDLDLQPGGDVLGGNPICSYQGTNVLNPWTTPPGIPEGCFGYVADEWMTFQVGITHGALGQPTRIRLWAARQGQPSVLVIDYSRVLRYEQGYGKLWFLPYHTNKSASQTHPEGYIWYDQLIISRTQLPDR